MKARALVVLVAALVGAAATARLGIWQLDRAAQKIRIQHAQQERRALPPLSEAELARDAAGAVLQQHRLAEVQGRWRPELTVYLDNRTMDGRTGFFAVTPLLLGDGSALLVQRGWLPRDAAERTHIAAPAAPAGVQRVRGRVALETSRMFEFTAAASGPIRQNLDLVAYARETGLPLRPLVLVEEADPAGAAANPDGLSRHWPQPAADVHKHYGYAFQWFALSALVIVLYAWFQLVQPYRQRHLRRPR